MQQINLDNIGLKGESKQQSFEDLCMYLLCRDLKISKIEAYHNQPGIETEPFEVDGKKYGFQAKFFNSKFDWQQIEKSITKAIETYRELTIFIFSNKDKTYGNKKSGGTKTKAEIRLEEKAKKQKITLEYVTGKSLIKLLSDPSNSDLRQLYFETGDELGFMKNSADPKIITFIQSNEYIDLPIEKSGKTVQNRLTEIISNTAKVLILSGNPGSGKTIAMHKLLTVFGGLDKKDLEEQTKVLVSNNAVPTLANLKNCATDSLENILRNRKNDSRVNGQSLNFIYLFDGLDELDENIADNILFQMHELCQKSDTTKIIISCRSGNINLLTVKSYFKNIPEYKIARLDYSHISRFFEQRKSNDKIKKLSYLKDDNKKLIKELKDILLIKLFWDSIEEIDEKSKIIDLFDKKINLLLNDTKHRKNIENLNLLNPKKDTLIKLNQDIAFNFQKKFQFRFSQNELQNLILEKFPRLDYKAINLILNYIADLFFENSYSNNNTNTINSYIYQHRMFQEYFFTQKLKAEYEKNPNIIRELKIIAHKEYFENLFLIYLRREYEKENNLAGCIELNLIDVYLGKNKDFATDNASYINSIEFIPALASQTKTSFNELMEDEDLALKDKISINLDELKKQFKIWKKNKNDHRAYAYLNNIWKDTIPYLIENIAIFWKANQKDTANKFIAQFKTIRDLYDENGFIKDQREIGKKPLSDPFGNKYENWIYYRLIIKNEKTKDIFETLIRKNYEYFLEKRDYIINESGKRKLLKSFFRISLEERKNELFDLIDNFNDDEFTTLLDVLRTLDYLPVFIESKPLQEKIKKNIEKLRQELNEKNIFVLFYKKFFNITLSDEESKVAKQEFEKLRREIETGGSYKYKTYLVDFAVISYVLDEDSIYSNLFKDYIDLLKGNKTIEAVLRDYISNIHSHQDRLDESYLKTEISSLWTYFFSHSQSSQQTLKNIKNILAKETSDIITSEFYLQLSRLNPGIYRQIIAESEIKQFENNLLSWQNDFSSYINRCFNISVLYSRSNPKKAKSYFYKGITEGILRHGWRKDTIVSYQLVDALEILWKNNWGTKEKLEEYSREVFELALKVSDITDGKKTRQGPLNVITLVAKNDLKLAEEFKKIFIEKNGRHGFANEVIIAILKEKIKLGLPIAAIKNEMNECTRNYDYAGNSKMDDDVQKFFIYLEIAKNDLFTDEERESTFEKMHKIAEEIKRQGMSYHSMDNYKDEIIIYKELCEKYYKPFHLTLDANNDIWPSEEEKKFIEEVQNCSTKKQLAVQCRKFNHNEIIISEYKDWKILVEKIFAINKNLKWFTDCLIKSFFPSTDFATANSKYFHFGVAAALSNVNSRQEILDYLFKHSGHDGFTNTMKAYEVLEDKDMCIKLFERYLKFCKLIVN